MRVLYERCAGIDIGKDEIAVAVRKPGDGPDGRVTVRRTYKTFYGVLREAALWLMSEGVTHVAMEATGIYSMPVYHALLEHGDFGQVLVCNAGHVKNVPDLPVALEGGFAEHHAMLCRLHLKHLDGLEEMIAELDAQIEKMMRPFRAARELLTTIPGIAGLAAASVISEIGADIRRYFPDAGHLASRAGLCPGNHESAGKRHSGKRRHGNAYLQAILVECAWAAVRHEGYLKVLYRRHVIKNGGYRSAAAKNKAIVTVAHAILVMIWHILATGKPSRTRRRLLHPPPGSRARGPAPHRPPRSTRQAGHPGPRRLTRHARKPTAQTAAGCCRLPG